MVDSVAIFMHFHICNNNKPNNNNNKPKILKKQLTKQK